MKRFTIIELLVVIVIIAILISLLMPALGRIKEKTKDVSCKNNISQITKGTLMYAMNNNQSFPNNEGSVFGWFGVDGVGGYSSFARPVNKYLGSTREQAPLMQCPDDRYGSYFNSTRNNYVHTGSSYAANTAYPDRSRANLTKSNSRDGIKITQLSDPSRTVAIMEYGLLHWHYENHRSGVYNLKAGEMRFYNWHSSNKPNRFNSSFGDGSVRSVFVPETWNESHGFVWHDEPGDYIFQSYGSMKKTDGSYVDL